LKSRCGKKKGGRRGFPPMRVFNGCNDVRIGEERRSRFANLIARRSAVEKKKES